MFSGNAEVDTNFAGGIGTDTLQVGTTGTAFVIANNDIWTGVTGVETISYVANTATTNTLALDVTAYAAGIRTIDQSAVTGATGNTIDISEFVGTDATTLTGSATGSTTITGGAGADTITGGSAADVFIVTAGNDVYTAGSGTIVDTFQFTKALLEANSGTTATYDGGAGTDIVDITTDGATIVDADFRGFTSIESLTTGDGTNSVILGTNANTSGIYTIVGGTGVDTITTGAGNHTIYGSTGADIIDGEAGTDTYVTSSTQVAANIEGAGTGTSTGLVINLGSSAITHPNVLSVTSANLASNLSSVASGQVAYLFNASLVTNSTVVDTISNIENVTLSGNGANYVVGSASANIVTLGNGADIVDTGDGDDIIIATSGALITADDILTGGAGTDALHITNVAGANAAVDDIATIESIVIKDGTAAADMTLTLTFTDANTVPLTIDASELDAGEVFTLVATDAEVDGALTVTGGGGADVLTTGDGADIITGGVGADTITGDVGADTIIYNTKLDGTAPGGIIVALAQELGIPVSFIAMGEKPIWQRAAPRLPSKSI